MQWRATGWILGIFYTFPSFGAEAITRLIPINLHLCKLSGGAQLRAHSLPYNHILHYLLKSRSTNCHNSHCFFLDLLTHCQRENIKGTITDMNNRFNEVFPSFDLLNKEFSPGFCLIDIFPSLFSFHPFGKYSSNNLEYYSHQLDNIAIMSSLNHLHTLIISDASIKNNMATSITYIHICDKPIIKMIHHAVNVTSTEAELFAIRYSINQAVNLPGISETVVITDSIYAAKKIIKSSIHSFQTHSASIFKELKKFFLTNNNNSIAFWECPSQCNWPLFKLVDRDTK